MIFKKATKTSPPFRSSEGGFSLLELSVVVAVLGILGGLSIANISKWLKLSHIDEAMTVLNNSLVDCLQESRSGKDPNTFSPSDNIIDNSRLGPAKYQIKASNNTCADFFIISKNSEDKFRFEMGYQITVDGNATKIASLPDEQSAQSRCYRWAGKNCGASQEQLDALAEAKQLAENRRRCKDEFNAWLNESPPNGGTGLSPYNRWNENSVPPSCSLETYAFEGEIVANQKAVEDAQERKLGKICASKIFDQRELQTTGIKNFEECGTQTFYFCEGSDKQSEAGMNVCLAEKDLLEKRNAELICEKNREEARMGGYTGYYPPVEGPDSCGNEYWMCDTVQYSIESAFKKSPCAGRDSTCGKTKSKEDCLQECPRGSWGFVKNFCGYGYKETQPNHIICKPFNECMCRDN